jgi:hypothetical protein
MSSHFRYELDERNLRLKLNGAETSCNESIWEKFENFSELNTSRFSTSHAIKKFNVSLNRNVILPLIFGSVIIFFSLLLYNFISINPKGKFKNTQLAIKTPVAVQQNIKQNLPKKAVVIPAKVVADSIIASTPTLAAIAPTPAPTATITEQKTQLGSEWHIAENGDIYSSPSISSRVIGFAKRLQNYNSTEETIYFIKVSFIQNGEQKSGYVRKAITTKGMLENNRQANNNLVIKKQKSEAEVLETLQAPTALPTVSNNNSEPELK